jgi:hypothetical protein
MPNNIAHFSIEADDLARARRFYEAVFGWKFTPWGPPDFFVIQTGPDDAPGIGGSLARRAEPVTGKGNRTFECTVSVDSIDEIMARVIKNGGNITMQPFLIETVGTLIWIEDTEGNRVGAMKYVETPH